MLKHQNLIMSVDLLQTPIEYLKGVGPKRGELLRKDAGVNTYYDMLTYYDVKNFAPWITCPVIMGVGLQDPICPPRTNFAPYNLLKGEKRYLIYPETGHGVRMSDFVPKAYGWLLEKYGLKK